MDIQSYYEFFKLLVSAHFYHLEIVSVYSLGASLAIKSVLLIERIPKLMKLHTMFSLLPCTKAD